MNTTYDDHSYRKSSSLLENLSSYFFNPKVNISYRHDIKRSILISKKSLLFFRMGSFLYSFMVLALVAGIQRDPYAFLTLPYWSFVLQIIYFFQAIRISIEKKPTTFNKLKEGNKVTNILYEMAFSWQFFNLMYYVLVLIPATDFNLNNLGLLMIQICLNTVNFLIMWVEQAFNMMRFIPRHGWFVVLGMALNFGIVGALAIKTGIFAYGPEFDFHGFKVFITIFMLVIAPIVHFIIGYFHYEYKKMRYQENRKKIREKLISIKTVDEKDVYEFYGGY